MIARTGHVYLIGAGPGDPRLITVKGRSLLRNADVVLYDRLTAIELLAEARVDAALIDVGKRPGEQRFSQTPINEAMIAHAQAGKSVVRLKGGDPCIFGRGAEEARACRDANVPCHVVPGVTSALAAPICGGVTVTDRGRSRSVAIVAGRDRDGGEAALESIRRAAGADTLVVLMGVTALKRIVATLLEAGRPADTPVACVEQGTTARQRVIGGTLETIVENAQRDMLCAPAAIVIGNTAAADARLEWSAWPTTHLTGRRVVLTGSRLWRRRLRRKLRAVGATAFDMPTTSVRLPADLESLDRSIRTVHDHAWIVFTSSHATRYFLRRSVSHGRDVRGWGGVRIAALGRSTTRVLARRAVSADCVVPTEEAEALVAKMAGVEGWMNGARVLVVISNVDGAEGSGSQALGLFDALRSAGAQVDVVTACRTVAVAIGEGRAPIVAAADAIVYAAPADVQGLSAAGLNVQGVPAICVGRAVAKAAESAGLATIAQATRHNVDGVMEALSNLFTTAEAQSLV